MGDANPWVTRGWVAISAPLMLANRGELRMGCVDEAYLAGMLVYAVAMARVSTLIGLIMVAMPALYDHYEGRARIPKKSKNLMT